MRSTFGSNTLQLAVLCFLLSCLSGCGSKFSVGKVEGTITLDGKPLPDASVAFTPIGAGAEAPASSGLTDSSGKYRLSLVVDETNGALIGKHQVVVSKGFQSSSDVATPEERAKAAVPNHDFSFEVKSGSNKADFNLETKKGKQ